MASFKEIATTVAGNWKIVDPTTKTYAEAVAKIQKDRYVELKEVESINGLIMENSCRSNPSPNMSPIQDTKQQFLSKMPNHQQHQHQKEHNRRASAPNTMAMPCDVVNGLHIIRSPSMGCGFDNPNMKSQEGIVSDRISPVMAAPCIAPDNLRLDHFFSNYEGNPMCGLFDEVDVSDEDILRVYHSSD